MKMNKKTIALLSTLAFAANTHGMWPSLSVDTIKTAASSALETTSAYAQGVRSGIAGYASAARPAVSGACQKAWSKIKENQGSIGITAATAALVYGGVKVYKNYTKTQPATVEQLENVADVSSISNVNSSSDDSQVISLDEVDAIILSAQNTVEQQQEIVAEPAETEACDLQNIFTSPAGNVLKVVLNVETGLPEFAFVNAQGEAVTEQDIKVAPYYARAAEFYFFLGKYDSENLNVTKVNQLQDTAQIELVKINREDGSLIACYTIIQAS